MNFAFSYLLLVKTQELNLLRGSACGQLLTAILDGGDSRLVAAVGPGTGAEGATARCADSHEVERGPGEPRGAFTLSLPHEGAWARHPGARRARWGAKARSLSACRMREPGHA